MSVRAALLVLLVSIVAVPSASAKDFDPGDLRVCNAKRCVAISKRAALTALAAFYYTGRRRPVVARRVTLGAPEFELRFRNGYVTGIVATAQLNRFLSYGVHLGWFARGKWYRVPDVAARELRRLTVGLEPLRVTRQALSKSR